MNNQVALETLLKLERRGLLAPEGFLNSQTEITLAQRKNILDWIFKFAEKACVDLKIPVLAVQYLDSVLALKVIPKNKIKKYAFSCLTLASKKEETLHICKQTITDQNIVATADHYEQKTFEILGCDINHPNIVDYTRIQIRRRDRTYGDLLVKKIVYDPSYAKYLPSVISSAIFITISNRKNRKHWAPDAVVQECQRFIFNVLQRENVKTPRSIQVKCDPHLLNLYSPNYHRKNRRVMLCVDENSLNLTEKVGEGSYGSVYKISDKYAMKKIYCSYDVGLEVSFIREISSMILVNHPNIVYPVLAGFNIFTMELMEGDLWSLELQKSDVDDITAQLLYAVQHLHEWGIIHRDINPRNILYKKDKSKYIVKISDFGASRTFIKINSDTEMTNGVCTLCYSAPEILLESPYYTQKSDLWSLGCTLYELRTGNILYPGTSKEDILSRIYTADDTHDPWETIVMSQQNKKIITDLLALNPKKRKIKLIY